MPPSSSSPPRRHHPSHHRHHGCTTAGAFGRGSSQWGVCLCGLTPQEGLVFTGKGAFGIGSAARGCVWFDYGSYVGALVVVNRTEGAFGFVFRSQGLRLVVTTPKGVRFGSCTDQGAFGLCKPNKGCVWLTATTTRVRLAVTTTIEVGHPGVGHDNTSMLRVFPSGASV
ncbi:hypothetical protein Tco_0625583 [Tanacetum coccineum]|uniref:Uncharacterized protein n=1 Tax=Tanacetum coccineum TaxID=301880 RepID=A0ABQ4WH89_9ASTR